MSLAENLTWQTVCHMSDLVENSGVCALLSDNSQVALFNIPSTEQQVFAIGNYDPIGKANVLYRGIVGSNQEELVVASPLYKQQFSLTTGKCLQEEAEVPAYQARIIEDLVQLLL